MAAMFPLRGDVFRGALLGAALFGVGVAAGCSGQPADSGGGRSDQVASIAGASAPAASPSGTQAGSQEGVMMRIDMTEADRQAVSRTYHACLATHGVRMAQKQGEKVPMQEERDAPAGYRACAAKKPYLDPLVDKTKNPRYADQFRAWLSCMNSHGVEVSGSPDDEFLNFGNRAPGIDGKKYVEIYRQCEIASYKW
jgi:hypothetical protein